MKTSKRTNVKGNKKRVLKKKKLSIGKLLLIAIVCFAIYKNIPVNASSNEVKEIECTTYTVCEGDTLWTIAQPYAEAANKDVRDIIYTIRKDNNNMSANLSIGQEIIIRAQF